MKYEVWFEESGDDLKIFEINDDERKAFNRIFGLNIPRVRNIDKMWGRIFDGIFPITGKPIRFHFQYDSWFETDDEETAQWIRIFFVLWQYSDFENAFWLMEKLKEVSK